jgi:PTH1 family peptidyl-tRNA hydrolase
MDHLSLAGGNRLSTWKAMKIIVGLGNPGLQYESTRHNVGFKVVERIAIAAMAHFQNKRDLQADIAKLQLAGKEVLLVKPTTFMNLSGRAVQAILHWYKVPSTDLMVVHDEVALPLGKLRLQKNGGSAGQHGIESIMECLGGNKDFDRLRFGVGPDPGGDRRAAYVLSPIPQIDREVFEKCLAASTDAIELWLQKGIVETMNKYNGMIFNPALEPPPKPPKPEPSKEQPQQEAVTEPDAT